MCVPCLLCTAPKGGPGGGWSRAGAEIPGSLPPASSLDCDKHLTEATEGRKSLFWFPVSKGFQFIMLGKAWQREGRPVLLTWPGQATDKAGQNQKRLAPRDLVPPARLRTTEVLQPPLMVPLAGDQVFSHGPVRDNSHSDLSTPAVRHAGLASAWPLPAWRRPSLQGSLKFVLFQPVAPAREPSFAHRGFTTSRW